MVLSVHDSSFFVPQKPLGAVGRTGTDGRVQWDEEVCFVRPVGRRPAECVVWAREQDADDDDDDDDDVCDFYDFYDDERRTRTGRRTR